MASLPGLAPGRKIELVFEAGSRATIETRPFSGRRSRAVCKSRDAVSYHGLTFMTSSRASPIVLSMKRVAIFVTVVLAGVVVSGRTPARAEPDPQSSHQMEMPDSSHQMEMPDSSQGAATPPAGAGGNEQAPVIAPSHSGMNHSQSGAHGEANAPAAERPRELVLGGFALVNVFIVLAAGIARRRAKLAGRGTGRKDR